MKTRSRAVFATSALLYSGPLYAGLGGFGFETVPLFAALFALWLAVVRPGDWPTTAEEWRQPRSVAWPLLILAGQGVLVAFCLAIGRGIGALNDLVAPLPLAFATGLCVLGIAIAWTLRRGDTRRIVHIPGHALGIGSGILDVAAPNRSGLEADDAFVGAAAALLTELCDSREKADWVDPLLVRIENAGAAEAVLVTLSETAGDAAAHAQMRLALRQSVARGPRGRDQIEEAVARIAATRDPELIGLAVGHARTLLAGEPRLGRELARRLRLHSVADQVATASPDAATALRGLAREFDTSVAA